MNLCVMEGNVTADPSVRLTAKTGTCVCRFTLGVNKRYRDQDSGEWKSTSQFPHVIVWGDLAETVADNISKGTPVLVVGEWSVSTYPGKDGEKKYWTEIKATHVALSFRPRRKKDDDGSTQAAPQRQTRQAGPAQPGQSFDDMGTPVQEDIPF